MQAVAEIVEKMEVARTVAGRGNGDNGHNGYIGRDDGGSGDIRAMRPVSLNELDTSHHPLVQAAVDAARRWRERYKSFDCRAPSLVLLGPNGTGKTHIARAIWWSMTTVAYDDGTPIPNSRRPIGQFCQAAELIARLAPNDSDEMRVQLPGVGQVIGSAPLVVVDDVGAEGNIQYVRGEYQAHEREVRYFRFIDWAYANDVPVIITTNLTLDKLATHVGRRAWDRLNEMAPKGQMVNLFGVPSWRVKVSGRAI